MRSQELDLKKYNTDKIQHEYLKKYDPVFGHLVDKPINLLELGILDGGSLLLWRDYFPHAKIFGIDMNASDKFNSERIQVFRGLQQDPKLLDKAASHAPDGFDIIIDDASHIGQITKESFWYLFENYLKPGGIYAIEDWGTGYWSDWPDGRVYNPRKGFLFKLYTILNKIGTSQGQFFYNHPYGMVGFIKQLVDEQGISCVLRKSLKSKEATRKSKFEWMTITDSIVFIKKQEEN